MYSTWKIALDSAWAGPSWTSCASRARSASWASTIRIWNCVGSGPLPSLVPSSVTSDRSPRSRNSHVLSRLRRASSSRDRSDPCWPSPAPVASRSAAERLQTRVVGALLRGDGSGAVTDTRRHGGPVGPAFQGMRLITQALPDAELLDVRLAIPVADGA